jgi:hypothetical protein
MPLRPSDKRIERVLREVHDREEAKRSLAGKLYPHLLKPKPNEPDDETKPGRVQGRAHLNKK